MKFAFVMTFISANSLYMKIQAHSYGLILLRITDIGMPRFSMEFIGIHSNAKSIEHYSHYNDVTWALKHLKVSATRLLFHKLLRLTTENTLKFWIIRATHGWCKPLTNWGRMTHICINELNIIGSDNGLLPDRRQAIIWTNAGILPIGPLRTNFSEILIETLTFSSKKMCLKVSSVKEWPFCLDLNVSMCSLSQRAREAENVLLSWRHTAVSATEHWCMFQHILGTEYLPRDYPKQWWKRTIVQNYYIISATMF